MTATKTKKAAAPKAAKTAKAAPATKGKTTTEKKSKTKSAAKKLSAIDAAAKVLAESETPMNCKDLIDAMATKGLWTSPGGKTPHATLYNAILREIATKAKESRFTKTERGKFAASA